MKKSLLLTVLLILGLTFISAQTIAEYTFSTTTDGTLEDMTGSIDLLTAGTYYDDIASPVTNIGFTFAFGTGAYTQFSANSNGQMQLGATAISGGSASPALNTPRLAPLSGDNAIRATGKLHYKVVGSEPNRKLVVEWLDLRVNYSSAAETGTYCRMQAWLYEGSNNIKFVYGTMWNMSTSTQARSIYIATSNVTGSLGQVTDIIGAMTWNSAGTGLVNTTFPASSAMANINSAADGSRRVFHFNYPDPSAPPSPAILLNPGNGTYVMLTDALSWGAGGGYVTSYDVYLGTNPTPPFVANVSATTYTPTLAAGTTYYWNIVAKNANGDAAPSATWSFMTPAANQLMESFEATTFPPAGWANPGSWSRSTSYYKNGVASAYKYGSTSTQYILSTPRLTIEAGSVFSLWTLASSTTATLQIVYSPDRTNWTQIGSNIAHAATYIWYNTVVDLSSLAGNNYYLGVRTGLQAVSFYTDLYIGPAITPEAPGTPVLSVPADLAINVNEYPTMTWTAPTAGGVPTGYRLYVGTTNPPTSLVADQTGLSYTYTTPLAYNTTYYWTVEAYNTAGTGPLATVRSFTTRDNPTVSTFPWVVDFGSTGAAFPPLNWTQLTGLPGQTLTSGGSWYQDDFGNVVTTPPNYSARLNIWSTSTKYWLVTPPIVVPANHELKFDLAYTTYSGTVTPTPGAQADDKFIVYISDNPSMTGATVLREWNNTGSPYVYDTISASGENHIINLGSYTGTRYIAFYGESTVSGGDNNVYVDNVTVRETPANPIFSYGPSSLSFGTTFANTPTAYQNVTMSNVGPGTINIALTDVSIIGPNAAMFSFNAANLPAALGMATIPVRYNPTAAGNHSATLRIVYNSTNYDVALSGNAYAENAFFESFEGATFPPADWATAPTAWESYTAAGYTHTGTKATKSGYSSGTWWLMTPALAVTNGDNTFSFWYRDYSESTAWDYADEYTYVMVSTTGNAPADFTTALWTGDYMNFTTSWQQASVDLSAYNGQTVYIAFKSVHTGGNYRIIDDVFGPARYVPAGGPNPVTINYPANQAAGLPVGGFDITWTPAVTGGAPTYYAVYMSQDEETIYDDVYFETTATSLNPTTYAGGPSDPISFNYLERWYFTVQAFNNDGDAIVEPAQWFEIEDAPQVITTFPWTENFDAALTLPADWTAADLDGLGTSWVGSTAYAHSTPNSFKHGFSTSPATGQNGWLITPAIQVPAGNYYLSWWNYNYWPTYMEYNGVKVNTTNDPNAAGWVELWSPTSVAAAWSQAVVNISAYAGQTVYFAFNYQGYDADDWYIDDVSVYELLVDTIAPSITHLPHLNTPREDLNYLITASIVDDPTWNNPIGGANLFYSVDGGNTWSAPIAMTPGTAPAYSAVIPAQALGTTVQYYMQAWDILNNTSTSTTYSFGVNDPTWIWYDQGGTTYLGFTPGTNVITSFGPTVLFENPFYGTGNAMQLLGTDGAAYYATTANLKVYSYDGTTITNLMTPLPINFAATTYQTFDLSAYNLQITTPYFLVAYEDIPVTTTGTYILWDDTYNYGTSYCRILSNVHDNSLYTLTRSGSWAIGAFVQTGASQALNAPVVTIASSINGVHLSWMDVDGASSYKVFGAADPYAAGQWPLLGTVATPGYTYNGTDGAKFFKVVADSNAPTRLSSVVSAPVNISNRPAVRAHIAPKSSLNRKLKK